MARVPRGTRRGPAVERAVAASRPSAPAEPAPPEAEPARRADAPGVEAWRLMVELFRTERPRFQAVSAEFDLSPAQAHLLHLLEPDRPAPMSAVAAGLACDASNVTGIVDRLEERGLIERRGAPHDRRVKMLFVTEEGARLKRELETRLFAPPQAIARLSRADQRALRDVLRRALGR